MRGRSLVPARKNREGGSRAGCGALALSLLLAGSSPLAAAPGARAAVGAASPAVGAAVTRSLLYPRSNRSLRFDHGRHTDVPCAVCHRGVGKSVSADDRHTPREASCRPCHGKATREIGAPRVLPSAGGTCFQCHLRGTAGAIPPRLLLPDARLRFSHRIHAERAIGCLTCHPMAKGETGIALPPMAMCVGCHGRTKEAPEGCGACHLTQKDGRLQTRFGSVVLRPGGANGVLSHTALFARRHSAVGRTHRRVCDTCHTERSCQTCHLGQSKPWTIHRGDYVTLHAQDARTGRFRCQSCHRSSSFCLSCHLRSGVADGASGGGFRPQGGARFHPPGFAGISGGGKNHHARSARRNLRSCSSCHTEASCIRCHGTTGRSRGGLSPHGRGFAGSRKCAALLARNGRVCLKCHRSTDPQLVQCR